MDSFVLLPPIAFILFLLLSMGLSSSSRLLSAKGVESEGKEKAYACGQNTDTNKMQPSYREFFPFAFFFTIMHAMVLIVATMPAGGIWLAVFFIAVALLCLRILFRR